MHVTESLVACLFERQVVELEKQLCLGDKRGLFQNVKLVQLKETKKVESQHIRNEEVRRLRDIERSCERRV